MELLKNAYFWYWSANSIRLHTRMYAHEIPLSKWKYILIALF